MKRIIMSIVIAITMIQNSAKCNMIQDKFKEYLATKQPIVVEQVQTPVIVPEVRTLYNTYSPEEVNLLFYTVEAEYSNGTFEQRCHIVSVIFNWMKIYQSTSLYTVLTPQMFSVLKPDCPYKPAYISPTTIQACEYVFANGQMLDTTGGALYFESLNCYSHEKWATFLFSDGKVKYFK